MVRILLAGESWVTVQLELKGRNVISQSEYGEAADQFLTLLEELGASVTYQPCHTVSRDFPRTRETLDEYDLVILSDVGADTLQITSAVAAGETDTDRCRLIAEYVHDGGALGMIGGYMSFAGKGGKARYARTPLAAVLPVVIAHDDDRVETPAGAVPRSTDTGVALPDRWPHVLGYNRFDADPDAEVWATVNGDPFLVVGDHGDGSAFAFATDCAPHWAPRAFLEWEQLPMVWERIINRVTDGSSPK